MGYEEFLTALIPETANRTEGVTQEMFHLYRKGTAADNDELKEWIKSTNIKYYGKEAPTLLGDFLNLDLEDRIFARFDCSSLYKEYTAHGWDIVRDIVEDNIRYAASTAPAIQDITDYSQVKDRLIIRPINFSASRMELKDCIYRRADDIALCLYILISRSDEFGLNTTKVQKNLRQLWNIPETELMEIAMRNTMLDALPRLYMNALEVVNPPYQLGAFMSYGYDQKLKNTDVPVITTTRQVNGAIAMFYPGVMEKIYELFGEEYYISFTATSEARVHAVSSIAPRDVLLMLKHINTKFPDTMLSSKVYRYNHQKNEMEMLYL